MIARRRGRYALAALATATALLLAGCGGGTGGSPDPAGELTVALQFPPRSDYAFDADDGARLQSLGVAETLTTVDDQAQPAPMLATAWEQEGDSWRFTLRPGVTFHDGTPLTPDAVVTALSYVAGGDAPPRAIRDIGFTVAADGPDAVRITTAEPDPVMPLRMSSGNLGILAPAAYAGGGAPAYLRNATGPFVLDQVDGAQSAQLVRNEQYWGEKAGAARITVRYVEDPQARALAVQAGDVQFAEGLPQAQVEQVRSSGAEVVEYPNARTVPLQLNQSRAPFDDVRVRQAVTAAIDRPVLAQQVLGGGAAPAADLFGAAVPWGETDPPPAADPERARQLLAEAGFGPENPLTVQLWTFPNRPELPTLANALQAMLAEAGVRVEITVGNYEAQEPEVLAGNYDMFLNSRSYLSDFPDAASTLTSDYTCEGSYAIDQYCSPAYDAVVARLNTTVDPAQRQQLFAEAAGLLTTDAVGVMLVHPLNTAVLRGATGFTPDPLQIEPILPQLTPTG
ncbi:Oligopeptide ABC transporter, periplasmic oligopeptide-binding protein OppA [Pseudonocardia sp. Ae168_Ps1]|uniref:ABC transporter substrate-binding protein n=1 Tax=unclassified Pseudonocardia TaxID=2619320 RepID=UPI00094B58A4|nr:MULTISPECIES: ABC transporter substrate-binding protein [unclassified Pseudonocardia]OLL74492.1 Oligopeptide ABC transporter, periplasmic oligopeptide-binding protein OppA [Pseudonocardia sp. Ae150A_Ps1]OLL80472.1 Oligopeptide ABC transporter, periplasmic oligopeptide-binding protein OppA [Pseudonocardia sp. Ae168_Ps1]OLL85401.1 Oligopeptide ABC transporter, periplasmic oligopeptide-binding protein OppA [Pseudonocardia sp. Ae263_Ps1]OLL94572.1 Oligopeptide ABC transporter, periplasmic oligop